jgi:hypothetical protein
MWGNVGEVSGTGQERQVGRWAGHWAGKSRQIPAWFAGETADRASCP